MAEPFRVAVRRGTFVESVHEVHGVAVRDGETVAAFGDPSLTASLRSAAKPLQALPLARAYPELGEEELAIAAASHYGTPRHIEAVRKLLAATGGSEDELDCGRQEGRPQEPIYDNCSGKHAGMLATCRAHGWPVEGYRHAEHPLQQLLLQEVAAAAELDPAEVGTGIDGCGVVAFAVPLERAAARLRAAGVARRRRPDRECDARAPGARRRRGRDRHRADAVASGHGRQGRSRRAPLRRRPRHGSRAQGRGRQLAGACARHSPRWRPASASRCRSSRRFRSETATASQPRPFR